MSSSTERERARILAIGDEVVSGSRVDSNSAELGRALTLWGFDNLGSRSVGDRIERIVKEIDRAASEAQVVLMTGGLGPTPDDRTRHALAAWLGVELHEEPAIVEWLEELFARFGRNMTASNRRQALVPEGCEWIRNPAGTAPALVCETRAVLLIALPGVPQEVRAFLAGEIGIRLRGRSGSRALAQIRMGTTGIAESKLADALLGLPLAPVELAYLPALAGVELVLSAPEPERVALENVAQEIRERLGRLIYTEEERTLEHVVGAALVARGSTLAVAESCTGGALLNLLTNAAGASRYLLEGAVTYTNESKTRQLGVDPAQIEAQGAVSEVVARQMAEAIRRAAGADFGLSTTGIAGPTGGTESKPVGTVWIACTDGRTTDTRRLQLAGDRVAIKVRAAHAAIDLLRKRLLADENS